MREVTNVSQYKRLPDGVYNLEVAEKPEKFDNGKNTYRKWKFKVSELADTTILDTIQIFLVPWESKELLLALGGVEVSPNNIDWDDDKVKGLCVQAKIITENYGGKDKEGRGVIKSKYVLSEIKSSDLDIQF